MLYTLLCSIATYHECHSWHDNSFWALFFRGRFFIVPSCSACVKREGTRETSRGPGLPSRNACLTEQSRWHASVLLKTSASDSIWTSLLMMNHANFYMVTINSTWYFVPGVCRCVCVFGILYQMCACVCFFPVFCTRCVHVCVFRYLVSGVCMCVCVFSVFSARCVHVFWVFFRYLVPGVCMCVFYGILY